MPFSREDCSSVNGIRRHSRNEKLQTGFLCANEAEKLNTVVVELPVTTLGHHGNQSSFTSPMVDGVKGGTTCVDALGLQTGMSSATAGGEQVWLFSTLNADDVENGFIVLDALNDSIRDPSASMIHDNIQVQCQDSETGCASRSGCFTEFPSQHTDGGAVYGQCLSSEVEMISQDKALLTTGDQCPVDGLECSCLVPESLDDDNGYCDEVSAF